MENQAHMEVNLDEGRRKKHGQIPWEPVKPSKPPTYKDPVKITLFLSEGSGSLMKNVEESSAPEGFDWRINRKWMSRNERKALERVTGIRCSGKDEEPLRVYDKDDGPLRLTNKEMRERRRRENLDPAEAMEEAIENWQNKNRGFRTFMSPKEWKNSPAIMRLRQALGLPLLSPQDAAEARERAMIEAARRATRDFPVCHPLCLFAVSPSARALADAEADLRAQMGVEEREVCRTLLAKRCGLRQRSQATVVEESVVIERKRRREKPDDGRSRRRDSEEESGDEARERRRSKRHRRKRRSHRRRRESEEESEESPRRERGRSREHGAERGSRDDEERSRGEDRQRGSRESLASSERSGSPGRERERERERKRDRERKRERERERKRCPSENIRRSTSPYHQKCLEPGPGDRGRVIRRRKPSKH